MEHLREMRENMGDGGSMMFSHEPPDDPVRQAYRKRRELDKRYLRQLTSLLGPEYQEMLPKASKRAPGEPVIVEFGTREPN